MYAIRSYYVTGAPGLAMVGIPGHGALHPILDGVVTDYPFAGDRNNFV